MTEEFLRDIVEKENEGSKNEIGILLSKKNVCNIICGIIFLINACTIYALCRTLGVMSFMVVLNYIPLLLIITLKRYKKSETK